jgi:DNA-binding MarR family transcriptional regulator
MSQSSGADVLTAEELAQLTRVISDLADEVAQRRLLPAEKGAVTPSHIRAVLRARQLRNRHFPEGLFADPAWDMLLDLYAARLQQMPVSVSSLALASGVPPATAYRWMDVMLRHDLIERIPDSADKRRVFVHLTDAGAERMRAYFEEPGVVLSCLT